MMGSSTRRATTPPRRATPQPELGLREKKAAAAMMHPLNVSPAAAEPRVIVDLPEASGADLVGGKAAPLLVAVLGTAEATTRIASGDTIRVDPVTGTVTVVRGR